MTYVPKADIARRIVDLCTWISEGRVPAIEAGMSLTHDLHFDSLQLMQFFSGVEELYADLALEEWFIEHSSGGCDTIASAVSYIARSLPASAATDTNGARQRRRYHGPDLPPRKIEAGPPRVQEPGDWPRTCGACGKADAGDTCARTAAPGIRQTCGGDRPSRLPSSPHADPSAERP